MSRRMMIAGNWKLNTSLQEAVALAGEIREALDAWTERDVMVAPPYPYLQSVSVALDGSSISVGAQELFYENKGAWTGAVSAPMLSSVGCDYVLVGHSERRQYFGETDATANKRIHAAFASSLVPVLCVGETLAEREAGNTESVVIDQVRLGLAGVDLAQRARMLIAYEPVWAIGTGRVATPEQAQAVHATIRQELGTTETRILYGGSVKPGNATELFAMPDIDGALVGGASLNAQDFAAIVRA